MESPARLTWRYRHALPPSAQMGSKGIQASPAIYAATGAYGIKLYHPPGVYPAGTGGIATKIRVVRCFFEESADTPAVLEVEVEQADVPSADEILSFAALHGNFVCISDRIFRRFEIILPPDSRLELLKDALLEVLRLEPEGSEGFNPYEVEDFVDALERARQEAFAGNRP